LAVGYSYSPTVPGNVPKDALLLKQELFGPVVALRSFDTEEEAITAANDTEPRRRHPPQKGVLLSLGTLTRYQHPWRARRSQ
jgi:hypothetical protein